jgi:hypothetical protein
VDFDLTEEQRAIQQAVRAVVHKFDDEYWLERDDDGEFPHANFTARWPTPAGSASPCRRNTAAPASA